MIIILILLKLKIIIRFLLQLFSYIAGFVLNSNNTIFALGTKTWYYK